jgi:uncharacterized protein YydD (DUF2326 family)
MLMTVEVEFGTDWEEELCDFGLQPEDYSSKEEVIDAINAVINKDWWNIVEWDMRYNSEVNVICSIADEEYQRFKKIEPDPFDVWAKAVRESRERRATK